MEINKFIDSTLLRADATKKDIQLFVEEGITNQVKALCVHISRIKLVRELLGSEPISISGTVGFPFGNVPIENKLLEIKMSLAFGANEIDYVINVGAVKDGDWEYIANEMQKIRSMTNGIIVKVILETCLLSEEEIIKCCKLAALNKIDFVKTSTGYSKYGARIEDVKIMQKALNGACQIKASGGITNFKEAKAFIDLGVTRIGTSRAELIINESKKEN